MPRRWAAIALLGALWAGGCTTVSPERSDTLSGRLALQIGAFGGSPARQWSAGFELRGTAQTGQLDLTSPLGTVVAQARWRPGAVELLQGGEHLQFDSLTALAQQLLGEPMPLEALFDWLRGRPWAQEPHQPTSSGFLQAGWAVDLSALAAGSLTARRSNEPAITLRARLDPTP